MIKYWALWHFVNFLDLQIPGCCRIRKNNNKNFHNKAYLIFVDKFYILSQCNTL